jgi:hypothetical protein
MKYRLLPKDAEGGLQFHRGSSNLDLCPLAKALLSVKTIDSVFIGPTHVTLRKSGIDPW